MMIICLTRQLNAGPANETPPKMTKGLKDVLPSCVVGLPSNEEPLCSWTVVDTKGMHESEFEKPAELIGYFQGLPNDRKKMGIVIWGSLTHLKDPEASKKDMTDHQKKVFSKPGWLEAYRSFVSELANACKKESIDLWINTGLGASAIEFINLSARP